MLALYFLNIQIKPLFSSYGVRITFSKIIIEKMLILFLDFGFHPNFCRRIFSFFFKRNFYFVVRFSSGSFSKLGF